jgi:hypothetical protein
VNCVSHVYRQSVASGPHRLAAFAKEPGIWSQRGTADVAHGRASVEDDMQSSAHPHVFSTKTNWFEALR